MKRELEDSGEAVNAMQEVDYLKRENKQRKFRITCGSKEMIHYVVSL